MRALTCHPEYRLLSAWAVPQVPASSAAHSAFSWPALLRPLRQTLISTPKMEEGKCPAPSLAPVCVCVGGL